MWDLILSPGIEPIPASLGVQSLDLWTARKPHYPTIHLCLWHVSLFAVVARKLKDKCILSRYGGLPALLPLTFRNPDTNFMVCIVLFESCLTPLEKTEVRGAWILCHTTSTSGSVCWLCSFSPTGREPQLREAGDCSLTLSTATKLRKRLTQPQQLSVGTGAHLSQQYNKGVPCGDVFWGPFVFLKQIFPWLSLFPSPCSTSHETSDERHRVHVIQRALSYPWPAHLSWGITSVV